MISTCFIRIITILSILGVGVTGAFANESPPPVLNLNNLTWTIHSSGIRSVIFVDAYQCAFYLHNKDKPIAVIRNLEYPVAIRIQILTSMLPDKMPEAWRETIESEVTGKAFRRVQKVFLNLDEGDVLLFVYLPEEATSLFLNDKLIFKDPGSELMQSLLEQWIGPHPISEDLKQALIGE